VRWYQKGKTNLDFTEARDSEWQWHQLGHMQVCTLLQTDNHASIPPLSFLQAGRPSCRPNNSVKALQTNILSCTSEDVLVCVELLTVHTKHDVRAPAVLQQVTQVPTQPTRRDGGRQ